MNRTVRWLRRRDQALADTPSWRLMQELKRRGHLRIASGSEAGFTKHVRRSEPGITVDSQGLPLYQVAIEDET